MAGGREGGRGEVPAQGKHTWEEFAADQGKMTPKLRDKFTSKCVELHGTVCVLAAECL